MSAHTPGPWYVTGTDKGPARRYLHIGAAASTMVLASMNEVHTNTVANSRLIAAAPDLLEALKTLVDMCWGLESATTTDGCYTDDPKERQARAAIVKATKP